MFSTLMAVVGSSVDDSDDVADVDNNIDNDVSDVDNNDSNDDNSDNDNDVDNGSKCQAKRWERGDGSNGNIQIRS